MWYHVLHLFLLTYTSIWAYHYRKSGLCWVFLRPAKSHLHSVKALSNGALGKVRSAKYFPTNGLCWMLFIEALSKILKTFCECFQRHSAKFSTVTASAGNGYFTQCPTRHSTKFFPFLKKMLCPSRFRHLLPSAKLCRVSLALSKTTFAECIILPSAALGKI